MQDKILAIQEAHRKVSEELSAMEAKFIAEMRANPEDYEDFSAEDAYVWFIEGLA